MSNVGSDPIAADSIPGIRFEIADRDRHRAELLEFLLEYFRVEEPITSSVGTTREDAVDFYNDLADAGLQLPVSYIAVDADSGRIVGCRLNEIVTCQTGKIYLKSPTYAQEKANKIARFIDDLSENLYQLVDSRKMMKFVVVGVHPAYFRRGIGAKLVDLSLKMAGKVGCDWVTTTATALRSQLLFAKMGFRVLRQISYQDYLVDGERVFKRLHDGATCGQLMGKKICM